MLKGMKLLRSLIKIDKSIYKKNQKIILKVILEK